MFLLLAVAGTDPGFAHAEAEFKGAMAWLSKQPMTRGFKHLMATAALWNPGAVAHLQAEAGAAHHCCHIRG